MPSDSFRGSPPAEVAGYRLLLPIGTGGMGAVYLCEREIVAGVVRRFAIKLLHPSLEAETRIGRELIDEARLAANIQHPCVVNVIEAGERDGITFLVMEYIEGDTLARLFSSALEDGELLPLPLVGRMLIDALSALEAAHHAVDRHGADLGIVHRDFSPQNLLVGLDGRTRLTDFGIAKAVSRISNTATGMVKGKVAYMAPEHALGQPLDARADVWSAGVVLWEALTGRPLFHGDNDAATILSIVSGADAEPPSLYRRGVPRAIDEVVASALRRDREARPIDGGALRERVERAWESLGLASADEVAAHVERVAGARLASRRERLAVVQRDVAAPLAAGTATDTTAVSQVRGHRARRSFFLAGIASLALLWWASTREQAAVLVALPIPSAAIDSPSDIRSSPPQSSMLRVEANEPIAQLRVGSLPVLVLPQPATKLVVPVSADGDAFAVEARTSDGRVARAAVTSGAEVVALRFPERAPMMRKPAARRVPDDDRLAPTP